MLQIFIECPTTTCSGRLTFEPRADRDQLATTCPECDHAYVLTGGRVIPTLDRPRGSSRELSTG